MRKHAEPREPNASGIIATVRLRRAFRLIED